MSILAAISMLDAKIAKLKDMRDLLAAEFLAPPPEPAIHNAPPQKLVRRKKKRKLSPQGYKNIVNGIQKRMKARKAAAKNGTRPAVEQPRKKPKFTKAGLEKLRQAAKNRWAEKRKLGLPGNRLPSKSK